MASQPCAPRAPQRRNALRSICPTSGAPAALQGLPSCSPAPARACFPGAPEGKEACPEWAGGSRIKVLAARRPGLRSPPRAGTGTAAPARAVERALRSGSMRGLSAAAAHAVCRSFRTAEGSCHTAARAGPQRCLSL